VLLVVTLCVHVILSMEGYQSVVTGDFPSNGVHVRIADLYFEQVFTTHNRCTSGMRFVMQYEPPIFGAHSSIISNLGVGSFFRKNDTRCKVRPARSHSGTGIRKYKSLSRNKSISACLCVYVFALSCVGRLLSPIKCPKHSCFQPQGARNT